MADKDDLRKRAEEILAAADNKDATASAEDARALIQELRVHQIELELQNEELRSAQNEIEESRAKFADLYDFAPVGYFTFDSTGTVKEVNLTGARLLGRERSKLIDSSFLLNLAGENRDVFRSHLEEAIDGDGKRSCELRVERREAGSFDASLESLAVETPPGAPRLCRTAIVDITERKVSSRVISQLEKTASISQLAAALAHNLNNMLTVIEGNIELALADLPRENTARAGLNSALQSSRRAAVLIKKLIQYSRQELIDRKITDMNRLVAATLLDQKARFDGNCYIETLYSRNLHKVNADAKLVGQVIGNLIVNACESMPQGCRVTIRTDNQRVDVAGTRSAMSAREGEYATISIADEGVGVAVEDRERIFEPFFSTKQEYLGAGLGLAVAEGIIVQHGGWIECESGPGRGSTFTIFLPAAGEDS